MINVANHNACFPLKNFYDIVLMLIWYKMMHKFSYEHNRSEIRALHPKIISKNLSGA